MTLSNYLTSSLWLSTPICKVRHLCALYNTVNVYSLILWLKLVRFYHALSNWPVSHDSPFLKGHRRVTLTQRNRAGLGFLQSEVATNEAVLAWANLSIPPTSCSAYVCLIQTLSKPEKYTTAIVRKAWDWQKECTKQS